MIKKKTKEKRPITTEHLRANDPDWEKVFKLRMSNRNAEAEKLKDSILQKYKS
jgi:hypothetical protein